MKIMVVILDGSNKPIDALDSIKEIEENGGKEQLSTRLQVASISPLITDPNARTDPSEGGKLTDLTSFIWCYHQKQLDVQIIIS